MKPATSVGLPVVYLPYNEAGVDDRIRLGAEWLRSQPGQPLVSVSTTQVYKRNTLQPELTKGALLETTRASGRAAAWSGGPILALWPVEGDLRHISDDLADRATAIGLLAWGDGEPFVSGWLWAHRARHLVTDETFEWPSDWQPLPPAVESAMSTLARKINHANQLAGALDERDAKTVLRDLHEAGVRYDPGALYTWTLANDFTATESSRLYEWATKLHNGQRLQVRR